MLRNTASVPISTIINTGIWWGVCKAPGFIYEVVSKHQFTEPQKGELQAMKTSFCAQLAPLIATTETALAGKVSSWPLSSGLLPLRLGGVALAAYSSYAMRISIPAAAVMMYLTVEALSQTTASAASMAGINKKEVAHINDNYNAYHLNQYNTLAIFTGILTASIVHGALLYRGLTPVKAVFISTISAIVAGELSLVTYLANAGLSKSFKDTILSSSGLLVGAGTGSLTLFLARLVASDPPRTGNLIRVAATAMALPLTGALAGASMRNRSIFSPGNFLRTTLGSLAGYSAGAGAIFGINRLAQKNFGLAAAGAAAVATTLALINSVSGYVVYGYPLEQSLSENSQKLWKKFKAPIEHLSILFQ